MVSHATFGGLVRSFPVKVRSIPAFGLVSLVVALVSCSTDGRTLAPALPEQTESVAIAPTVTTISPAETFGIRGAWSDGADLDARFTCFGDEISPPFEIVAAPEQTVSLAVLLYDVDAPGDVLWAMANIAGDTVAIGEGAAPPDVIIATNSEGNPGYQAPCPSAGDRRQFLLTVFALDAVIDPTEVTGDGGEVEPDALLTAIEMRAFDLAESTFYVQAPE